MPELAHTGLGAIPKISCGFGAEEFLADTATWRLSGSQTETPVSGSTRQSIKASITKRVSNASASLVDLLSYGKPSDTRTRCFCMRNGLNDDSF
jgi:hypothetical protein